jgi:DNA-directed RNA polymerase subunit N (RpoN/RPB10)
MIIPIRCFTCGKVLGHKWEPYQKLLKHGSTENDALESLKIERYCCKRMMISHVDLVTKLIKYS